MSPHPSRVLAILGAALLSACTATTSLTATPAGTTIAVKTSSNAAAPRTDHFGATTFGNYEFRAERAGSEAFYGRLPLKFNGGYLALDLLFFCPAMFLNLREPFPLYEIDMDQRVVRYRLKDTDPWSQYVPSARDVASARTVFGPP